jgi:hypothetical protein
LRFPGLDPDSDDEGIEEEEEESQSSLVDLEKRYEEERNALMAKLKGEKCKHKRIVKFSLG